MFTKAQELELVRRAKGGDEAAFTALIRPLREKVFGELSEPSKTKTKPRT